MPDKALPDKDDTHKDDPHKAAARRERDDEPSAKEPADAGAGDDRPTPDPAELERLRARLIAQYRGRR